MKRPTNRRTVLMAAGAAAFAVTSGTGSAQSADIRGAVTFVGGAVVPKGDLTIYLENPAIQDAMQRRVAEMHVKSDGGSTMIDFLIRQPKSVDASPTLQIVARLTRADGWLLARGSAQLKPNAPVYVTLNKAMY